MIRCAPVLVQLSTSSTDTHTTRATHTHTTHTHTEGGMDSLCWPGHVRKIARDLDRVQLVPRSRDVMLAPTQPTRLRPLQLRPLDANPRPTNRNHPRAPLALSVHETGTIASGSKHLSLPGPSLDLTPAKTRKAWSCSERNTEGGSSTAVPATTPSSGPTRGASDPDTPPRCSTR